MKNIISIDNSVKSGILFYVIYKAIFIFYTNKIYKGVYVHIISNLWYQLIKNNNVTRGKYYLFRISTLRNINHSIN